MRIRHIPNACLLVFLVAMAVSATWGGVPSVSAATITTMEYFIDTDPGEGLGTPIPVSPNTGSATVNLSIPVADLSQGSHLIFIRAKDDTGHWGPVRQANFEMPFAGVSISPVHIDSAEYFFDQDPGPGNGISIPAPVDGLFDSLQEAVSVSGIDLSSLSLGPHTLFVRMHGSDGIWGPARSAESGVASQSSFNFEVSGTRSIVAMEYFIDTDPGPGNAIPLPLPSVNGSIFQVAEKNLPTDPLSLGTHLLYLRAQDGDGRWGPAHQQRFEMITTDQTISTAEYFVDADPGEGNGSPLSPIDGAFDEGAEQVQDMLDTLVLTEGIHQVYARAQSSSGGWSATVKQDVEITSPLDTTPPTTPIVIDGGIYTTDASGLFATWQAQDPESGISKYEYSIGTTVGGLDVLDWTDIGTATSGTLTGGVLVSGSTYYINIRATNGDGFVSSVGSSDGIVFLSPLEDPDGDGFINDAEVTAKSDPLNIDSRPGSTSLTLRRGFNQISFPAEMLYFGHLSTLLEMLGGADVFSSVQIIDPVTKTVSEAGYNQLGQFYGQDILLPAGQGLPGAIIYAKHDVQLSFSSIYCHTWNFKTGINLVGTPCAPGLTAFQLLQAIGDSTVVSSIQRFNPITGQFETAGYGSNGQPTGVDFPIVPGEGYVVTMKSEVLGFRP